MSIERNTTSNSICSKIPTFTVFFHLFNYSSITELFNFLTPDICIMSLSKSLQFIGTLASLLSPALVTFASLPPQLPAPLEPGWQISLKFPDRTQERERIRSTGGGGSRGIEVADSCMEVSETTEDEEMALKTSLKALIPTTDLSKTVVENPSLFVYVPKTTAKSVKFLVRDKNGTEVYRSEFVPPKTSGIVKVTIPETVFLEVDQEYKWELTVMCNPKNYFADENKYVEGLVLRTQLSAEQQQQLDCVRHIPDLQSLLELPERQNWFSCVGQITKLQKLLDTVRQSSAQTDLLDSLKESPEQAKLYMEALVYAKADIWSETIDNMAQLRDAYPEEWKELLESVGLEDFAEEKLLDCCTAESGMRIE